MKQVIDGTDTVYKLAKKYHSKPRSARTFCFPRARRSSRAIAWPCSRAGTRLPKPDHGDIGQCRIAVAIRLRNPYPGKLGVVEEGALADLILVDGDPLEHLDLVGDPGKNFDLIMKDGKIYKNTVN